MSRFFCKFISILTVCAMLTSCLAGCGEEKKSEKKFRQLYEKGIVVANNITVERIPDYTQANCFAEYIAIDGLKNQAVEDRINRRIREVMEQMRDPAYVPPYRGIALKLRECGDAGKTLNIHFNAKFNSNNILSVNAFCQALFRTDEPYETVFSYSYNIPMNFDLATGEEMALKDLFVPGTDYIELVNRSVDQCLMQAGYDGTEEEYGAYSYIKLASSFRTVRPEQKFILDANGEISLYIDYDTPEFYTEYDPMRISLSCEPFGDAYMPFRAEGTLLDLFESKEVTCQFLSVYNFNRVERNEDNVSDDRFYGICQYRDDTPEAVIKQVRALTFDPNHLPLSFDEFRKQAAKEIGKKKKINIFAMISTHSAYSRTTEYYSFTRQLNYSAEPEDAWTSANPDPKYFNLSYNTSCCFDREGNPVDVRSLFTDPDKADALLEKAIIENIDRVAKEIDSAPELSDEQITDLVRQLLPHINGVALNTTELTLSYDLSDEQIDDRIRKMNHNELDYAVLYGLTGAAYSDLGYENLVFFRDVFA